MSMGTWDCGAGNQVSDTGSTEPLVYGSYAPLNFENLPKISIYQFVIATPLKLLNLNHDTWYVARRTSYVVVHTKKEFLILNFL